MFYLLKCFRKVNSLCFDPVVSWLTCTSSGFKLPSDMYKLYTEPRYITRDEFLTAIKGTHKPVFSKTLLHSHTQILKRAHDQLSIDINLFATTWSTYSF